MKDKVVSVIPGARVSPYPYHIPGAEREKAGQQGVTGTQQAEVDCGLSLPLANKVHP